MGILRAGWRMRFPLVGVALMAGALLWMALLLIMEVR